MNAASIHLKFALIGNGRLAGHLQHYFYLKSVPLIHWSRSMHRDLSEVANADVVMLAISDGALAEWVDKPEWRGKTVVHFSGSQYFQNAFGFHPLMTFTPALYTPDFYPTIPFVADKGFPYKEIFPFFTNSVYEIDPQQKPLYHALCHMAANFPALLWVQVFRHFEEDLGLPRAILQPIIEKILSNTVALGSQALAGPLQRRDFKTIALHHDTLKTNPNLNTIYERWTDWAKEMTQ